MPATAKALAIVAMTAFMTFMVFQVASGPPLMVAAVALPWLGAWGIYAVSREKGWMPATLVHVSMTVCLVLLEIPGVLGLVDYRDIFPAPIAPMHDPRNDMDEDLLFRRKPFTVMKGATDGGDFGFMYYTQDFEDFSFDAKYDEDGFRNPKGLKQADILLIGDSFTEALPIPDGETVSDRLGEAYGVPAANYGMMAYGPPQQIHILERYALELRPKVIVWLFFEGNDLGDVRYYDWAKKDLKGLRERYHGFPNKTLAMNAPRMLYHMLKVFKPSGEARSAVVTKATGQDERIYFLHQPKPLDDRHEPAMKTSIEILSRAAEICAQHDIRFVVGFIPTKFRVYSHLIEMAEDATPRSWELTPVRSRFSDAMQRLDKVSYLDLTEPLRRSAEAGKRPYYRVDSHWNSTGHAVAAREIQALLGPTLSSSTSTQTAPL